MAFAERKIVSPVNPIETATVHRPLEIISAAECDAGLQFLREEFGKLHNMSNVSITPILLSGGRLGNELADYFGLELNPMRMSYYKADTSRLEKPVCLMRPNIKQIINPDGSVNEVVFAECVVDSQGTLTAAMETINKMIDELNTQTGNRTPYPRYSTFAYVSKTGNNKLTIPNLTTAFNVHPDVWVGGRGCDLPGNLGRELSNIVGILSLFATKVPCPPFYSRNF